MASRRQPSSEEPQRRTRPATTPQGREAQLTAYAFDLAEKRLLNGSATAAEVVHFLKLGSSREQLEQQRLEVEVELQRAKAAAIASQAKQEELYAKALSAMRTYSGQPPEESDDEYEG